MAITFMKASAVAGAMIVAYMGLCIALLPVLRSHRDPGRWRDLQEDTDILADFRSNTERCPNSEQPGSCSDAHGPFFFGLATAPAHVEDELNDIWLDFAQIRQDHSSDGGVQDSPRVRAWKHIPLPDQRLRFWTQPEIELDLSQEVGVTVFRLGIDWGRIVPEEPINGTDQVADRGAVEHYKNIFRGIQMRGMRIMLTLFHHSIPKWALSYGGWTEPRTVTYFADFARYAEKEFGDYVDYWVTFNEPHIYVILTHCSGTWPPGGKPSLLESLICFSPFGAFGKAMAAISDAHKKAYDILHEGKSEAVVGVAHHVGVISPYGILDIPVVIFSKWLTEFQWIDDIQYHLDFCGINYYGQEFLSTAGLILVSDEEYSEAGRGVFPDGLFKVLVAFHQRYMKSRPNLRYIITENGFADEEDVVRRPYLLEHLLAVHAAREEGVPIDGYLHWTISDNWEWADGYCPKFGLADVDRSDNLTRSRRPSFYLYQEICSTGIVSSAQRKQHWNTLRAAVSKGGNRSFCRAADSHGRMWAEGLDDPRPRLIADKEWRFGKYENPNLQTYVVRSMEVVGIIFTDLLKWSWGVNKEHDVSMPVELASGEL